MSNIVQIGKVVKAHGILGEILVIYYADSLELLKKNVLLGRDAETVVPVVIKNARFNKEKLLIHIEGVINRTEAEKLREYFLFINESELPPLAEDEVYRFSLLGFSIYEGEKKLGTLHKIEDISGQELWFIESICGQEILFPAVDAFISSMNFDTKRIYIKPPQGLLDVYIGK